MDQIKANSLIDTYGSKSLDNLIARLQSTSNQKRRYEYVLWLSKKLPILPKELQTDSIKVKGCVSQVFVMGKLSEGKLQWEGYSDALITKGLLALLIEGLKDLSPEEVLNIDPGFIEVTGLNASLTPSRSNGFLNILLNMKAQAKHFSNKGSSTAS